MNVAPIRVLLVEDYEGDARLVQMTLAKEAPGEFTVTRAKRLADALESIGAGGLDAVLCDLGLPDSSGLATARAVMARAPELALVVFTGSHDEDLGRKAIREGAQDYLVKGEAGRMLIARTLRYAIERKRMEGELRAANQALEHRVAERTAELQAAVTRLGESEARFRGLIEHSLAGVYISRDGVFVYANPRLEQLLGYGPGEMVGIRGDDIVLAEDLPIVQAQREKLRAGAASSAFEVRVRRRDGRVIELGVQGSMYEFDGQPATIGMAQDISEKKRAEEQIQDYLRQLEATLMGTVKMATTVGELRDPYTAGHERGVGDIAAALGAELGLDARRQQGLRVAGYLHDIGKVIIPSEILSKPGPLGTMEFHLVQEHARASHEVLKNVAFPWPVAEAALQHHERLDGSGYPQGLKGEAILLEARILAVADVVEAMSSHRPYRESLGIGAALAEIEQFRGVRYDAQVADACLRLFREKGYSFGASGSGLELTH